MTNIRDTLHAVWLHLNPKEPSPHFLVGFMASALAIFALGLAIGGLG